MDCNAGQFVRFTVVDDFDITYVGKIVYHDEEITKIETLEKPCMRLDTHDEIEIINIADSLEDLLEVNDIVHYLYKSSGLYGEITMTSENTLCYLQKSIKDYKITGIELHENRNVQVINNVNG